MRRVERQVERADAATRERLTELRQPAGDEMPSRPGESEPGAQAEQHAHWRRDPLVVERVLDEVAQTQDQRCDPEIEQPPGANLCFERFGACRSGNA